MVHPFLALALTFSAASLLIDRRLAKWILLLSLSLGAVWQLRSWPTQGQLSPSPLSHRLAAVQKAAPDVFGELPLRFDPRLRNPCWQPNNSRGVPLWGALLGLQP